MKRLVLTFALCLLSSLSSAFAAPQVSVDTQYMLATDSPRIIPILVSGSVADQIDGAYLAVQIGDGGEANQGSLASPRIINLDLTGAGTVFHSSNPTSSVSYLGTPSLIALGEIKTNDPLTVDANGVLAYLTVNPHLAALGSYNLSLSNVGASVIGQNGGPWSTEIYSPATTITASGTIQIVALHQSTWNAAANGAWTNHSWTSSAPPVPNYTTDAVLDTPYTVNVTDGQEANSMSISGGGKLALAASGKLAVTGNVNLSSGGTLSLAAGSTLNTSGINLSGGTISATGVLAPTVTLAGGTLDAPNALDTLSVSLATGGTGGLSKSGAGTVEILSNATYSGVTTLANGCLVLKGANSTLDSIVGSGDLTIASGSTLTAKSIKAHKLTIGGVSAQSSANITAVPEPQSLIMLTLAAMGIIAYLRQKRS